MLPPARSAARGPSTGRRAGRNLERLLRSRILGPTIEDQLEEEIDLHVELLARELTAEGMNEAQARAEAAQRFSDRAQVAAACSRIARGTERRWRLHVYWSELGQDVRYGLRQLARARAFAAVALLTLAAGIGATTAIFSVVEGVVLRRFPFAHPERVVGVEESFLGKNSDFSVGNFVDMQAAARGGLAKFAALRFNPLNLSPGSAGAPGGAVPADGADGVAAADGADGAGAAGGAGGAAAAGGAGEQPERVLAVAATSDFFDVFGVHALLGRTFSAEEDQAGRDQVAVLSHALWRQHFGADPAILTRTIHLSGRPYRVIGVMPAGFDPTLSHEELWLPLAFTPAERAAHDDHFLTVAGLLRPGMSAGAVQAQLSATMRRLAERYPDANVGRDGVRVAPLAEELIGPYKQRLFVLLGAVGLVLLIACANVASLLLARGSARARELAIRTAVGAGGRRIARQLLTESAVLALAGGALGVGLAAGAVRLFVRVAPAGIPRAGETRIDGTVLLFALAVSMAASLLFGMAPALRAARQDPQTELRGGGVGGVGGGGRGPARDRMRNLLVLAEIALALTLLTGAGLLLRSALNLQRTPIGFDSANLLAGRLTLPEATYPRPTAVAQVFTELAERLAQEPGVRAAAAVSAAPLGTSHTSNGLLPEGKVFNQENLIEAGLHIVSSGYFGAMRIPLAAGRPFMPGDAAGQPKVMIVSRALARSAWGSADPLGKRIACCEGDPQHPGWKTVIGVVGDVRSAGPAVAVAPEFYLPISQAPAESWTWNRRTMTLVARGDDPGLLAGAMRASVRTVDRSLPLTLAPMDEALYQTTAEERFHTLLLAILSLLGLFLAAVGTYGVIAYFAGLRTQEIGIRMALGARRRDILALLATQGARPVAGGLLLGAAGALAATRWLRSSLYGVGAADPWTLGCVILLLAVTAAFAVLIPALEAARIDPRRAIQQG
jgi:putative ABC transport system permease protein